MLHSVWRSIVRTARLPIAPITLVILALFLSSAETGNAAQNNASSAPMMEMAVNPPGREYSIRLKWPLAVSRRGLPIIEVLTADRKTKAQLNLALRSPSLPKPPEELQVVRFSRTQSKATWTPVYGERNEYPEAYFGAYFQFATGRDAIPVLDFEVRVYNEGVAWRYRFPPDSGMREVQIDAEESTVTFPEGTFAWATYRAQANYERVPLGAIKEGCERPLTLEFPDGSYGALAEAGMDNYSRMKFAPVAEPSPDSPAIRTVLDSPVRLPIPSQAPWRVLMLGASAGQLLERNHLLLTLNDPSKIRDVSWIKPGKVMREVTLSTKGGKELVDFAVTHNLQYIEYDAGWYGHEYDENQDARTVTPDPDRTGKIPNWNGLKLQEVIDYARQKGIGVILYVNRRHLEKQLDELLPLYKSWGVAGLKYGFVNVGSQEWSKWLHDAVRKAAANQLMVDIHDEYRPTGLSRTWPNLMTQEGILGNEAMPDATHNVTLPFTRGLAGAGDYTICYYTPRIKTTHPHQLALSVIMYSPWQFVFWYDKPSDFQNEPEMPFFEQLPTVWDDTKVLKGEIAKYISIARRKGESWWLATANNTEARTLEIPLSFLDPNRRYLVDLYEEPAANNRGAKRSKRTNVAVSSCLLEGREAWKLSLPASGGHAAVFRPASPDSANSVPVCKR